MKIKPNKQPKFQPNDKVIINYAERESWECIVMYTTLLGDRFFYRLNTDSGLTTHRFEEDMERCE